MKTSKAWFLLLTPLLLLIPLLLVTVVYASPPTAASGDFTLNPATRVGTDIHQADGNTIITFTRTGSTLTGTFSGSFDTKARVVIHPNGNRTTQGVLECDCTVEGKSGTLVFRATSRGNATSSQGRLLILSGTGELENLHGVLAVQRTERVVRTYSGKIHFDP